MSENPPAPFFWDPQSRLQYNSHDPLCKNLIAQAEKNGLHDDQWGSRSNRTSTDPALQKMMTFEYGRYTKATIAVFLS